MESPDGVPIDEKKFLEEKIKFFLDKANAIKWDEDDNPKKTISGILKKIDDEYYKIFDAKAVSKLLPQLHKGGSSISMGEKPSFLKNTFVADSSFLTNYQKFSRYLKNTISENDPTKPNLKTYNEKDLFPQRILNMTPENVSDVHANSKHYYPLYKDLQFTDFGEMNKEKSNAHNYWLRRNINNYEENEKSPQLLMSPPPFKSLYPGPIFESVKEKENIMAKMLENKLYDTKNNNLKKNIEFLGGIEDTITIMNNTFQKFKDVQLDLNPDLNLIDIHENIETQKNMNKIIDPYNQDPFYKSDFFLNDRVEINKELKNSFISPKIEKNESYNLEKIESQLNSISKKNEFKGLPSKSYSKNLRLQKEEELIKSFKKN